MNKLEKVAIKYARERGRPLCLIINNMHLIEQSDSGYALLHALQQRAEAWAQAKALTSNSLLRFYNLEDTLTYKPLVTFLTDDYWVCKSEHRLTVCRTHEPCQRNRCIKR